MLYIEKLIALSEDIEEYRKKLRKSINLIGTDFKILAKKQKKLNDEHQLNNTLVVITRIILFVFLIS